MKCLEEASELCMFLVAYIMNFVGSQELCSVSFDLISTSLDMLALDILVLDILGTSH